MSIIIATDVGGTCTDTVIFSAGEPVRIGKALSTPPDYGAGVLDSVERAVAGMDATLSQVLADTRLFIHGSTIVDNTLLTQSGAETGLITTKGFEDTLVATRGAYGRWSGLTEEQIKHPVMTDRPTPLVPRARTVGVAERVDYKGAVIRPPRRDRDRARHPLPDREARGRGDRGLFCSGPSKIRPTSTGSATSSPTSPPAPT